MVATCLLALTLNIFMEAEGEPIRGMEAVASVTTHRVNSKRYPNSYMKVVTQRKQFSWTNGKGLKDEKKLIAFHNKLMLSKKMQQPRSQAAWRQAQGVAIRHLVRYHWLDTEAYQHAYSHYHAVKVKPKWSKNKAGKKVGKHIFYKADKFQ